MKNGRDPNVILITVFGDVKTVSSQLSPQRLVFLFIDSDFSDLNKVTFFANPRFFKVFCFKKPNGKFKWIDENGENAVLGPCVAGEATTPAPTEAPTCKTIELLENQVESGMEVNCKINSREFKNDLI